MRSFQHWLSGETTIRHPAPLKFLLYLEWILLSAVLLSELGTVQIPRLPRRPLLNLLCLSVFAGLGLRLPSHPMGRIIYTGIEIVLVTLMTMVGGIRLYPVVYIILVIRNCLVFENRNRRIVTIITFFLFALSLIQRAQYFDTVLAERTNQLGIIWITLVLFFGLVIFFLQLLINAVLSECKSREELAIAHAHLRQYALQVEELATEKERNRIAREIHDALGHSLTVFNLHLEAALRLIQSDPQESKALLLEAKQLSSQALKDVRQSVATLRTSPFQNQSFEEAIARLMEEFQRSMGYTPHRKIQLDNPISKDIKIALYRIVQEALTNICKYACATEVTIQIQSCPNLSLLQLKIEDNGNGFDPTQTTSGFGLQGMRERTLALNGQFEISSAPGLGCKIRAEFPLNL